MNIPFVKYNNLGFITSSVLIVVACISLMFKGLNLGLDFTGGVSLEIKYDQKADLSKIRSSISKIENANFVVLNFGSDDKVLIKFQSDSELNITADTVKNQLEADDYLGQVIKSETIFPQIGEELRDKGGIAILVAMLVILVYIIFRFQIKFGYGAIAALFHDVFIILGIFSVFNLAFDLSVLAAILAIVGYSLNDSIVVSDRIRENFLDPNKKGSSEVLINDSLNQVFARTIITSFTTLLVLMALLFAGGEALKNFSLALAIGVVIGSYSSIFIVVKVLLATNLSKKDMEKPKNEPEESYSLD
jgi:preprotein translocase subunit SecF|tara:strand:- start:626 stop:1537 length:912 start_codon:yes stop_codon:yes gene_type:complete